MIIVVYISDLPLTKVKFCFHFRCLKAMAFLSKFGNILKQTNANGSLSSPSLFQAIRCMSSSKLFIGGGSCSRKCLIVWLLCYVLA